MSKLQTSYGVCTTDDEMCSSFKTQEKPIYMAVSSKVPQKGRILILDKIISQNDPVYWWGWEQTNIGRVNGVKTIADNVFKVTTKNAVYIVQVFDV